MRTPEGRIVVAGSLAQKPAHGGHAWVFLQYLLGFRRLGWDVLFLDRLPSDPSARGRAVDTVADVMEPFGLGGHWALVDDSSGEVIGLPKRAVVERTRNSTFLVNVMGFLTSEEILGAAPRRVFLDIDPGFPQMWHALALADVLAGPDDFVTIGENVGQPGCAIPTCGRHWVTTPQPVVLDRWPAATGPGSVVTSVATWRGAYGPVDYRDQRYGLRAHEFRRFAALPRSSPLPLEVALAIDTADSPDRDLLERSGWRLADPTSVARDLWSYRAYIRHSAAELMIAKNMYVRANSGWFSDRSICYLASGRPVVAQDTGFSRNHPTGMGLLAYSTFDEAVDCLREVAAEPDKHARAARELAEAHFDSDIVLDRLLAQLASGPRGGTP